MKLQNMWFFQWNFKNVWILVSGSTEITKHVNFDYWEGIQNLWILFHMFFVLWGNMWIFSTYFDKCEIANFTLKNHMFLKVNFTCFYMWNTSEKAVKLNHNTSVLQAFDCSWPCEHGHVFYLYFNPFNINLIHLKMPICYTDDYFTLAFSFLSSNGVGIIFVNSLLTVGHGWPC